MSTKVDDREKALIKNTGILAIGTLASKIFSFFLLPLYTEVLTTNDYGTVDVLQTVSSFAMPFITLQLCSALFRFVIEKNKDEDKAVVITTGVMIELINVLLFSIIVFVIDKFFHIQYCGLFVLYFATSALLEICQNITRGFGNNKLYSVMSFAMTAISVTSNIVMILGFGMRGDSILIAASLAYLSASLIAIIKQSLWKYFKIKYFTPKTLKEMLVYCLPLIPNAISWWLTNASDRLLIRVFLGADSNGIYAAANKIPTIYTTIYNVYNIAWVESISRSMENEDQEKFVNNMFEKSIRFYGCLCLGIICCMSLFFEILIGESYRSAYPHVYILMVAIFVNSVCSLFGGIFTAHKSSKVIGRTTVVGAITNLLINVVCINYIGIYAASISTLISYLVILLLRNRELKNIMNLRWPKAYLYQFIFMLAVVTLGYVYKNTMINIVILIVLVVWTYHSNKDLIKGILDSVVKKLRKA